MLLRTARNKHEFSTKLPYPNEAKSSREPLGNSAGRLLGVLKTSLLLLVYDQSFEYLRYHRTTDLSRAEGRHRKSQEECSATLARAKDAEKGLRKETGERERVSAELARLLQVGGGFMGLLGGTCFKIEAHVLKVIWSIASYGFAKGGALNGNSR